MPEPGKTPKVKVVAGRRYNASHKYRHQTPRFHNFEVADPMQNLFEEMAKKEEELKKSEKMAGGFHGRIHSKTSSHTLQRLNNHPQKEKYCIQQPTKF